MEKLLKFFNDWWGLILNLLLLSLPVLALILNLIK
jgi:hypothetical protein